MTMSLTPDGHLRHFALERLVADDLPEVERDEAQSHLDGCAACGESLAAIRADVAAFAVERPYAAFRIEHERRKEERAAGRATWPRGRFLVGLSALAAATAAAFLFALPPPTKGDVGGTTRIKGAGVDLSILVATDGVLRPLPPQESLAAGATLQLIYDAGEHRFMAVLGIDGAGHVSLYFPEEDAGVGHGVAAPPPDGVRGRLPFSLTLDATPGDERFFAIFGPEPFGLEAVIEAARAAAADAEISSRLALPPALAQATARINKR